MKNQFGKKTYKIHKWCGLLAGIFILVLGLTGSILVFHDTLEAYEHQEIWQVKNSQPVSIDAAYKTINQTYPGWEIRLQRFSEKPSETLIFSLRRPDHRLVVFSHPANGNILKVTDSDKTVTSWLLALHYSLQAGLVGKIVVFVIGLVFLASLITGLLVYRKAIVKTLLFRTEFKRKNKRSLVSSLHRFTGVWALLLNLLLAFTGTIISYDIVVNGLKTAQSPAGKLTIPEISFSIDQALAELKAKHPEFKPSYMRFPKAADQPLSINGKVEGQPFFYSKFYNAATFELTTGKLTELKLNTTAPANLKFTSIVRAIHFVEFENLLVKLLFCLTGLSAPVLSITGFLLWKWKQKKKKLVY